MFHDLFIRYPLAAKLLTRMHELVFESGRLRPEGMLLLADSNNGKSHLLRKFCSEVPIRAKQAGLTSQIPVILVQAPVNASRREFYASLATALGIPDVPRMPAQKVRKRTLDAMVDANLLAVCIDELHHIVPGGPNRQRIILDDLKFVSNEMKIPIFLAGTALAYTLVSRDEQYASRFPAVMLPRWDLNKDFLWLLASMERALEVTTGDFTNPVHAKLIWAHSRGLIGRIWTICDLAQRKARLTDSGRITEPIINAAGYSDLPWMGSDPKKTA